MIRTTVGFFVFAALLCAYVVFYQGDTGASVAVNNGQIVSPSIADVTRGESNLSSPTSTPTAEPEILQKTMLQVPEMGQSSVASRILAATGGAQARPKDTVKTDNTTLDDATSGVLAALGLDVGVKDTALENDPMLLATSGALQGISQITGRNTPDIAGPPQTAKKLQEIVAVALEQGRNDQAIDELLNKAAKSGEVTVPEMLVTSDGRVDTATLLSSILNKASLLASGQEEDAPVKTVTPVSEVSGVEVRVVQTASKTEQYNFYTVVKGDSLGSIAAKFYGNASDYQKIFKANRQRLSSPDRIRAGQRLVIPNQ